MTPTNTDVHEREAARHHRQAAATRARADYHSWKLGRASVCIGHLPNRTHPALYLRCGHRVRPVAWFRSEADAKATQGWLDSFIMDAKSYPVIVPTVTNIKATDLDDAEWDALCKNVGLSE